MDDFVDLANGTDFDDPADIDRFHKEESELGDLCASASDDLTNAEYEEYIGRIDLEATAYLKAEAEAEMDELFEEVRESVEDA